ncbi:MAG: metallophosphoesterase [Alphaproteobacteria bacterium]|nr:metallophosphoesterase [Alphaproteobacteria bacterium]
MVDMKFTRRHLLRTVGAGGALAAASTLAGCAAWPIQGSSRGPLRLVFYTDVHARQDGGVPEALGRAAARINVQKPDLVLGGGDLVAGNFDSTAAEVAPMWDAYMAMHRAIRGEHHVAIGNHDLMGVLPRDGSAPVADPRLFYKQRLGVTDTYRAFDALGYHVMLLDPIWISGDKHQYHGRIAPPQLDWIEAELSRIPRSKPIVLVTHIPLLTAFLGAKEGMAVAAEPFMVVTNNREVLALFAQHNLALVLQGHLHVSEQVRWRGTNFITGGAICGKWWRGPYFGTAEGFTAITLHPDRVEWQYLDYGWHASTQG